MVRLLNRKGQERNLAVEKAAAVECDWGSKREVGETEHEREGKKEQER